MTLGRRKNIFQKTKPGISSRMRHSHSSAFQAPTGGRLRDQSDEVQFFFTILGSFGLGRLYGDIDGYVIIYSGKYVLKYDIILVNILQRVDVQHSSRNRSSHSATQPLCQSRSGWRSHSATVAEWLLQPLWQSGWVAEWLHQATVAECLNGWIASAA